MRNSKIILRIIRCYHTFSLGTPLSSLNFQCYLWSPYSRHPKLSKNIVKYSYGGVPAGPIWPTDSSTLNYYLNQYRLIGNCTQDIIQWIITQLDRGFFTSYISATKNIYKRRTHISLPKLTSLVGHVLGIIYFKGWHTLKHFITATFIFSH